MKAVKLFERKRQIAYAGVRYCGLALNLDHFAADAKCNIGELD